MGSVVHEPARDPPGLEPPRIRQERAKRLESGVESARGPLSEPTRAASGLESARRPLFEPPRAGCQETRGTPGLEGLEPARLEPGSSRLGSCTTLGVGIQVYSGIISSLEAADES